MKRIVLHIGTEKTATTSLQAFFALNHQRLSHAGIWYPCDESLDYCHRNGHFPLAASTYTECPDFVTPQKYFDYKPLFQTLFADFEARPEDTVLLSAEHFSSRCSRPERIERLGEMLGDRNVEIIVYVRPQQELLLSAYSTFLKSGGKKTLEELCQRQWLKPGAIYFNYFRMLNRWWDVFGRDRVTLRVFQAPRLIEGDIYRDFIATLGLEWDEAFVIPERQNPPICKELADFLFLANQHFPAFIEDDRAGWELGNQFRREIEPLFPRGRPLRHLLSKELERETAEFFARFNAKLAAAARPDLNGELFVQTHVDEPLEPDASENVFCDEFVGWVIEQWKSQQSQQSRPHAAIS